MPQVQVNQPRREPGRTNGTSTNQGNDRHEKFILPPTKTLDHQVSNIYTNQKPDSTTWGTRWPHLDQTKTIKLLGLALGDLNNYTSLLDSIERDRTLNDSHIKHMRDLYKIQHHLQ
ncbi:MAG: hypothetical protein NT091_02735 [Candidatus Falkowbacteria bacterium]|nr:hypothetical protein [Candidatus Falkowbacteria bacterium]